jgi:hypothetical protein
MPREVVDTFPNTHAGLATSAVVLRYMRKKDRSHRYSRHFPRGLRSIKFHIVKESWHKKRRK